jgi:hypothetical protein
VGQERLLQGAVLVAVLEDGAELVEGQARTVRRVRDRVPVLLEGVAHVGESFRDLGGDEVVDVSDELLVVGVRVSRGAVAFLCEGFADHLKDDVLLLRREGGELRDELVLGEDVSGVLKALVGVRLFVGGDGVLLSHDFSFGVFVLKLFTEVNFGFGFLDVVGPVGVSNADVVDLGLTICTVDANAELSNVSVNHQAALLSKTTREDAEAVNIAVLNELLGRGAHLGLVEVGVCVYTFLAILENCVAKDLVRTVVVVRPNERDLHLVLMRERVRSNGSTVRAKNSALRSPTAEICFHFDFYSFLVLDG